MSSILFLLVFIVSGPSLSIGVPLDKFFPFGITAGDSMLDINGTLNWYRPCLQLPSIFPYFDHNHRNICITTTGFISFDSNSNFHHKPSNLSTFNNSYVFAPFWFEPDSNETNEGYYQIYSFNRSSNISTRISRSIRAVFPEQRPFEPKLAIIATWNQTEYLVQTVLSTDSDRSFVFILYHNLHQYVHVNGTAYPRVGFVGDRPERAQELLHSGTENVGLLSNLSNVNAPGLFVFRVDTEQLNAGGCEQNSSIVYIRPRMASVFGSTAVIVSGPCFNDQTQIDCHFGSLPKVTGLFIDQYRAICLSPFVSKYDSRQVNISIDIDQKRIEGPIFTFAPMPFGSDDVKINLPNGNQILQTNQSVTLRWEFPESVRLLFRNQTDIRIELWGVSFNDKSELIKDNQPFLLASNLPHASTDYTFRCPSISSNITTGFIRVVAQSNGSIYAGLNTGLLVINRLPSVAKQSCEDWAKKQPNASTWNQGSLLQCPMNRWQAIAGGFCCYQADRQCHRNSNSPSNCWLHQARPKVAEESAVECYTSLASNSNGAGAECCYDNNTFLITRGRGAGTDNRYHPSQQPIKHFFDDTLPFLQCCLMSQDDDLCDTYLTYRPTRSGSNTMGDTGRMWGDPHLVTLDGASYTFNGYGEYVYLTISNQLSPSGNYNSSDSSLIFTSQIRTEPIGSTKATVATGFAAQSRNGGLLDNISIIISSLQQIIIRHNNEIVEFENNAGQFVFPDVTIDRSRSDHFILTWSIGVSIDIKVMKSSQKLFFEIGASVASGHRTKTYGLLGFYDGDPKNDFRNRTGQTVPHNASEEDIFHQFGQTWSIEPKTSLFFYERDQTAAYFQQQSSNFKPTFLVVNNTIHPVNTTIIQACEINQTIPASEWTMAQRSCYFDYFITGDRDLAAASLKAGNALIEARNEQMSVPEFNEKLPLRMNPTVGEEVTLNFSTTNGQRSNSVMLTALHLPENASFNNKTGIFFWKTIEGKHHVSIQANDLVSKKINKRDVFFDVKISGVSGFQSHQSMTMILAMLAMALIHLFA